MGAFNLGALAARAAGALADRFRAYRVRPLGGGFAWLLTAGGVALGLAILAATLLRSGHGRAAPQQG